jgi:hypothetical protein
MHGRHLLTNISADLIIFLGSFWQYPKNMKHLLYLRTAQAKEYSLDKEQTSCDDLLDALRFSLKGYNIK